VTRRRIARSRRGESLKGRAADQPGRHPDGADERRQSGPNRQSEPNRQSFSIWQAGL